MTDIILKSKNESIPEPGIKREAIFFQALRRAAESRHMNLYFVLNGVMRCHGPEALAREILSLEEKT